MIDLKDKYTYYVLHVKKGSQFENTETIYETVWMVGI